MHPPGRQPLLKTGPYTHQPSCRVHLASLTNSLHEVRLFDWHVLYNTVTWRTAIFVKTPDEDLGGSLPVLCHPPASSEPQFPQLRHGAVESVPKRK